jgi:hypothetical protein
VVGSLLGEERYRSEGGAKKGRGWLTETQPSAIKSKKMGENNNIGAEWWEGTRGEKQDGEILG